MHKSVKKMCFCRGDVECLFDEMRHRYGCFYGVGEFIRVDTTSIFQLLVEKYICLFSSKNNQ